MYARILFGASATASGAVALLSHGSFVASALGVAQLLAGIAILLSRTARLGSIVLGAVYAYLSLAAIPGIVRAPTAYVQYGAFFEAFAVVCGALAAYAPRTARAGLGLCSLSFATAQIAYLGFTASLVPAWIPPTGAFWAIATAAAFALAGVAMLADRQVRLAMRLTTLMLLLFGGLVWIPRVLARPQALANWSELAETFLIAGAVSVATAFLDSEHVERRQA